MKRQCLQKLILIISIFCISLSFFISAYADAFTGAYLYTGTDPVTGQPIVEVRGVNPTGQTFTGSNVIEMNAYNNAPVLTSNTFNGTTSIDPAFTDIESNGNTYNGTTTITYDGIIGGNLESNNDTFATANLNTSNADVELNNPTFNGNTTLQAQNVSLGSISQMDSLLDIVYLTYYDLVTGLVSSNSSYAPTVTNPYTGHTLNPKIFSFRVFWMGFSNGTLNYNSEIYYGNFGGFLQRTLLGSLSQSVQTLGTLLGYYWSRIWTGTYNTYSFTLDNEYYSLVQNGTTTDFRIKVANSFDVIISLLNYYCSRFYNWYYPLDNVAPEYWRYYNTDTELSESIGLAGLWYNISWYLGEIYQNLTDAGSDMTSDAQSLGSSISALNTAEESVNTQIQSAFSTVSGIMTLPVISAAALCISWIEYMWVSLGIFQSPTLLAYMCVILMMLVGFAKYRSAFR